MDHTNGYLSAQNSGKGAQNGGPTPSPVASDLVDPRKMNSVPKWSGGGASDQGSLGNVSDAYPDPFVLDASTSQKSKPHSVSSR
jgi:hypothetical protein